MVNQKKRKVTTPSLRMTYQHQQTKGRGMNENGGPQPKRTKADR